MTSQVQLSEVAEVTLGQTFRGKAEASDNSSGVKLIQIRDIREGVISSSSLGFANVDADKLKVIIKDNDLLFPLRGSRFEMCMFESSSGGETVTTTNQIAIIRPKLSEVRLEYMLWYFNSLEGRSSISLLNTGTAISKITSKQLTSLRIPVPELYIQDRVVAVYRNWKNQKSILSEMILNGDRALDKICFSMVDGNKDD